MPQPLPTFLEETVDAARGTWALVLGRPDAPRYFDFSQRGLVGSFIALVLALGIGALGPSPIAMAGAAAAASLSVVILTFVVLGAQYGILYLLLRQLGRADSFVPFMVAYNWVTLFQALIGVAVIILLGPPMAVSADGVAELTSGSLPYFALSIAVLVIWVNVGRLVLTLRPLHVAIFIATLLGSTLVLPAFFGAWLP